MPGFEDGFLGVPERPGKPRSSGLTHVIDKGLNLREIEGLFDTAGAFVDIVKLGWGTSYVTNNLEKKIALYRWVQWIQEELDAGAWRVIAEGREGGTAGIYRPSGELRTGLVDEIEHAVPFEALIWEAPTKESQAWFIKHFGTNVNLGNIPPDEVIALETL